MSKLVHFSPLQDRASAACNRAKASNVIPFASCPAAAACTNAGQYSTGTEPRAFQLETADGAQPHSRATALVPPRRSMIDAISMIGKLSSQRVKTSSVHELKNAPAGALGFIDPMGDEAKKIGERLKYARLALALTQTKIAAAINIGVSGWSQFESGERPLTRDVASRLFLRYGLSLDWLFHNDARNLPPDLREKIYAAMLAEPMQPRSARPRSKSRNVKRGA